MYVSRRPPTRKTVEKWIKDYPYLQYDGVGLRCNLCEVFIACPAKTHLLQHIRSLKHKARENKGLTPNERQRQFNSDLLKVVVSSNITLHKLNNMHFKQFLQNCVDGKYSNVTVPEESTLRKNYLPTVYEELKAKINSELNDKYIWTSVNETIDSCGRNIVNVLAGGMDETKSLPARLLSSTVVKQVDSKILYESIDNSLKILWGENYEINKGRVLLFVSDATPCMIAAGKCLCQTYYNAVHVTCLAHALNSIAETIKDCYPNVDKLITNVKKTFLKAPARINLFREILPDVPLPPEPDIKRWGTWLEATSYYYVHFDRIKIIMQQLNPNNAASILNAQSIFDDPNIREDLKYLHFHFSRVPSIIRRFEISVTSNYSMKNIVDSVLDLRQFMYQLTGPSAERIKTKFDTVLKNNPGFVTMCRILDLLDRKEVDFSETNVNVPSLRNYAYFRYAPVTSADVERTLSNLQWIFNDKRYNLSPEHLQQLLFIQFHSTTAT